MSKHDGLDRELYTKAKDAVEYYQGGSGYAPGGFAVSLIECLFKADEINFEKLRKVFPEYAAAVEASKNASANRFVFIHDEDDKEETENKKE